MYGSDINAHLHRLLVITAFKNTIIITDFIITASSFGNNKDVRHVLSSISLTLS